MIYASLNMLVSQYHALLEKYSAAHSVWYLMFALEQLFWLNGRGGLSRLFKKSRDISLLQRRPIAQVPRRAYILRAPSGVRLGKNGLIQRLKTPTDGTAKTKAVSQAEKMFKLEYQNAFKNKNTDLKNSVPNNNIPNPLFRLAQWPLRA